MQGGGGGAPVAAQQVLPGENRLILGERHLGLLAACRQAWTEQAQKKNTHTCTHTCTLSSVRRWKEEEEEEVGEAPSPHQPNSRVLYVSYH